MISEMVETKERIYRDFSEGYNNIRKKYIGKILNRNTIEGITKDVSELTERIVSEVGIKITPGEVTATANGSVTVEEPYVELYDGSRCKLSDWLNEL